MTFFFFESLNNDHRCSSFSVSPFEEQMELKSSLKFKTTTESEGGTYILFSVFLVRITIQAQR